MKLRIFTLTAITFILLATAGNVFTNSSQPPAANTGAPGEQTCARSGCHSTNSAVSTAALLFDTAPANGLASGYTPGQTYNLIVNANSLTPPAGTTTPRYGFSLTAVDGSNNGVGTFTLTNTNNTSLTTSGGKSYVGHKSANTTVAWTFRWTAPGSGTGDVTFYIAANSSNNNNNSLGDNIFIRNVTVSEATTACTGTFTASVNASSTDPMCPGDQVTLTAVASGTGVSGGSLIYQWSNGSSTPTITVSTAATYSVTITDGACTDVGSVTLTESEEGIAAFTASTDSLDVILTSTTTGDIASAVIDFGDGDQVNPTSTTVTHTYADTGMYTITLTVTDECGRTSSSSESVHVDGGSGPIIGIEDIEVINSIAIYPNPMNANASINLGMLPQTSFNMVVLDVMGRLVIDTEVMGGQDNRISGVAELEAGTYIYQLRTAEGKVIKNGTLLKR